MALRVKFVPTPFVKLHGSDSLVNCTHISSCSVHEQPNQSKCCKCKEDMDNIRCPSKIVSSMTQEAGHVSVPRTVVYAYM
jgi:hypothetical protein